MPIYQPTFVGYLILWLLCVAYIFWGQRRAGGAGLVISYVVQLWLLHWLAAAMYALPWYEFASELDLAGLQQSVIAIGGFTIGCVLIVPRVMNRNRFEADGTEHIGADSWLIHTYLLLGAVAFFVLEPIFHPLPTIGAVASAMSNLLLAALAMECWSGINGARRASFWRWVGLSALLPFVTITTKGFLGYGFAAMLTVFAFVANFYRPRWKLVASSAVVGYLALSLYVTYMRDRDEIRSVVWRQESYSLRLSQISTTFSQFELFNPRDVLHLRRIDKRLNQNLMIGMAVDYLESEPERFARGRTIWEAVLSPIPRILWPDKPTEAGSGELVSEFTGRKLNTEGTSIGIGHVMEWYVNFGSAGVFLGMALMGVVIGYLDRMAARQLHSGNWPMFMVWWLPGLSLLQVGGSLVEAVSSACAGLLVAIVINWYRPRTSRRMTAQAARTVELAG